MAVVDQTGAKHPPQPVVAQLGLQLPGGEPIVPVPGQRRVPVSDVGGHKEPPSSLHSHGLCYHVMIAMLFVRGLLFLYGVCIPWITQITF